MTDEAGRAGQLGRGRVVQGKGLRFYSMSSGVGAAGLKQSLA